MTPRGRKKSDDLEVSKKQEIMKSESITSKKETVKHVEQEKTVESTKEPVPEPKKVDKPKKSEPSKRSVSYNRDNSKPKIEFNLSDGVTWRDFAALILIFFKFFWWIAKIVLWPFFWIWAQNVKIKRFIFASDQNRVMTEDEHLLFESVPTVFILTGLAGGILLGLLISLNIHFDIDKFVNNLQTNFIQSIGDMIGGFINFIWTDIIKGIILPIFGIFGAFFTSIKSLYDQNPFAAFFMLVILGIVITIVWITFQEKIGIKITQMLRETFGTIYGTPFRVYDKFLKMYRSFNRKLTELLIGKDRLDTRTQAFFKRTLLYTGVLSLWTFIAGVYIGLARQFTIYDSFVTKIIFTSIVLITAGFISGIFIFALVTRYFDLMNRKKYIASEFIKEPRS